MKIILLIMYGYVKEVFDEKLHASVTFGLLIERARNFLYSSFNLTIG